MNWPFPALKEETAITVIIPYTIYQKMVHHALSAAFPSKKANWKEVGGFLLGKWLPSGNVLLTDLVSVSSGSSVFVSISDPLAIQAIPWDRVAQGEPIVGWFHTHPGHGLFLSGTDQKTQISYQHHNPNTFALVMDPTQISVGDPGVRSFQVDEGFTPRSREIPLKIEDITDFLEVKHRVLGELMLPEVPAIVALKPAMVENEFLSFQTPQSVQVGQEFALDITLKTIEAIKYGSTRVQYLLEFENLELRSRILSNIANHEVGAPGLLARFHFHASSVGYSRISLQGISLQNEEGRQVALESMHHTLAVFEG